MLTTLRINDHGPDWREKRLHIILQGTVTITYSFGDIEIWNGPNVMSFPKEAIESIDAYTHS